VICSTPAVTPVTTPVEEPIDAKVPLLLQVPPALALLNVIVEPTQTLARPVIGAGNGLTVTVVVVIQPVTVAVNVIVITPALIPESTPVVALMLPTAGALLLHVPPPVVKFSKVIVPPTQTWVGPVMAAGSGCTVTTAVLRQVVANV
jgi:hypothetical protein